MLRPLDTVRGDRRGRGRVLELAGVELVAQVLELELDEHPLDVLEYVPNLGEAEPAELDADELRLELGLESPDLVLEAGLGRADRGIESRAREGVRLIRGIARRPPGPR